MKSVTCDACSLEIQAATFDDWFAKMRVHYQSAHGPLMAAMMQQPKEEGAKWMAAARARFDAS